MKFFLFPLLLHAGLVCQSTASAQASRMERLTFLFYNVENLYDTIDDPYKGDDEFLPGSTKKWDNTKYNRKISDITRALTEAGGKSLPDVIGLCEVENHRVLDDLIRSPQMLPGKYKYIHYNDRDSRGIDQALLYKPSFRLISGNLLRVKNSKGGIFARGILYVTGTLPSGEILHVFVNHWPARTGNSVERENSRKEIAAELRRLTDEIRSRDKNALIVIMGDMNDEPDDASLKNVLEAVAPGRYSGSGLVNLMIPAWQKGEGTVTFDKDWKMLDNLIVSVTLTDAKGFRVEGNRGFVYRAPWMEFRSGKDRVSPKRTYSGNNYSGGVSDHFPVFFRMVR
jgi:endonuclease/exonuclease/phosphatase family metal-dependent hydrolase